jgi:PAS domain S-box-containing protein
MPTPVAESTIHAQLRKEAETRLKAGTAAASNWTLGVDALQLLHRLSSDPGTAADALKLLHELQVHQVELDLQNEEMHANERRLVAECSRYRELYECAPLGYFCVDFHGEIIESNLAGAALFRVGRDELTAGHINRFLAAESRSVLAEVLKRLAEGGDPQACEVMLDAKTGTVQSLRVMARSSPDRRYALLLCCECA